MNGTIIQCTSTRRCSLSQELLLPHFGKLTNYESKDNNAPFPSSLHGWKQWCCFRPIHPINMRAIPIDLTFGAMFDRTYGSGPHASTSTVGKCTWRRPHEANFSHFTSVGWFHVHSGSVPFPIQSTRSVRVQGSLSKGIRSDQPPLLVRVP